jgi:DHA1 family bicyclomycin/chloramphenicol resistance-like MFS transporter
VTRRPDAAFLATLASITLIGPLAVHVFLPVMPVVKTVFNVSDAMVGLTFTVTLFVIAFATLVYGSLSDRHGRRPLLLGGLLLFTVGGGLSALATSTGWLIAGRVVQAMGAGCSGGLTRAIARDAYGTEGLVKIIAYLTMAYTLGPMISPLVGGILLDLQGWRAVFWFSTLAGVLISTAAYFVMPETHVPQPAPARHTGAGFPHAGVLHAGFLHDYVRLFSRLRFTAFVLQSGFSSGCFFALGTAASFMMKDYLGRSATEYGLYFLMFPCGFFLGNLTSSRISQRFGIENMVLAGSLVNFAAVAGQSVLIFSGHLTPLVLFAPGFLITFGQGLAMPNAQVGAMRVIPSLTGTASGIGVFCQMFIGALFAQIYTWASDGTPVPMVITLLGCSALTLAAGATAFALKGRDAS